MMDLMIMVVRVVEMRHMEGKANLSHAMEDPNHGAKTKSNYQGEELLAYRRKGARFVERCGT